MCLGGGDAEQADINGQDLVLQRLEHAVHGLFLVLLQQLLAQHYCVSVLLHGFKPELELVLDLEDVKDAVENAQELGDGHSDVDGLALQGDLVDQLQQQTQKVVGYKVAGAS